MGHHEAPSPNSDTPQASSKRARRAGLFMAGLTLVAGAGTLGTLLNRGGDHVSAATPSDADRPGVSSVPVPGPETTKYPETPSLAYVESEGRDSKISSMVTNIATRVINDAAKHPERTRFDDLADSTAQDHEGGDTQGDGTDHDGQGPLTEKFDLGGGSTLTFTVGVETAPDGSYVLSDDNHELILRTEFSGPSTDTPGATFSQTIDYSRSGAPGDAGEGGLLPWTVSVNEATRAPRGGGSGGAASAGWNAATGIQPGFPAEAPLTVSELQEIDQFGIDTVSALATRVGI